MKNIVILLSLIILTLSIITGASLAYFEDVSNGTAVFFKAGNLEVDITRESVGIENDWIPNEENPVSWSFTNTGTKSAYIRAKIKSQWKLKDQDESAWAGTTIGENPDAVAYTTAGNPRRYIHLKELPRDILIYYGNKQIPIANARFQLDEDQSNLIVSVDIYDGWTLGKMHLYLTENSDDFDGNNNGHLPPGQFPYHQYPGQGNSFIIPVEAIFKDSLPDDISYPNIYAALHIEAFSNNGTVDDRNVDWKIVSEEPWVIGVDGYWYLLRPLLPGETVDISFVIKLLAIDDDVYDYKNAKYSIDLKLDYIQSSNDAISNHSDWSQHPLLN